MGALVAGEAKHFGGGVQVWGWVLCFEKLKRKPGGLKSLA